MTTFNRRQFIKSVAAGSLALALPMKARAAKAIDRKPNIVMIYVDDMGYGDVACFGAKDVKTPNLDRMAAAGVKFTHCYNSSSACSPSRAALLTGCYHARLSIFTVFGPSVKIGLNPSEITIAELLRPKGYATGVIGKWHLGSPKEMMPNAQGFDWSHVIPVSHDYHSYDAEGGMPIYENDKIVDRVLWTKPKKRNEDPANREAVSLYTSRFTAQAEKFITKHKDDTFFLYVAHPMPHVPIAATKPYIGTTKRGLYGDTMAELDTGIGRILDKLKEEGIAKNTIVVFASDNGPWLSKGKESGSAGPLRDGKRSIFDGGVRTPAIVYWPGKIKPRVCDTPCAVMDFYATFAAIGGAKVPTDRKIDAVDLAPLLWPGQGKETYDPDRPIAIYQYMGMSMGAMRRGKWKIVLPRPNKRKDIPLSLFDMTVDPGESNNLAEKYPEVVKMLMKDVDAFQRDLGEIRKYKPGPNVRPIGRAANDAPTAAPRIPHTRPKKKKKPAKSPTKTATPQD
jgi:arylsulfatase A-like enzyme